MTEPYTISLDIRNSASNGQDGFTNTTTSDGQTYCYKWSGGTDGAGDVQELRSAGVAQINVNLIADPRYHIVTGAFSAGDTQFTFTKTGDRTATITDAGTAAEQDYFNVQITDTTRANCTFWCDPRVGNRD